MEVLCIVRPLIHLLGKAVGKEILSLCDLSTSFIVVMPHGMGKTKAISLLQSKNNKLYPLDIEPLTDSSLTDAERQRLQSLTDPESKRVFYLSLIQREYNKAYELYCQCPNKAARKRLVIFLSDPTIAPYIPNSKVAINFLPSKEFTTNIETTYKEKGNDVMLAEFKQNTKDLIESGVKCYVASNYDDVIAKLMTKLNLKLKV